MTEMTLLERGCSQAHAPNVLYVAPALYGFGQGIFFPAINACAIDLGEPARKGRALANMFLALEIAIGGGAVLAGWYFSNNMDNMPAVFYFSAAMSMGGLLYLFFRKK